ASEAGFFNIDIDSSTLVDINKATISEQQILNYSISAMYAAFIREIEPKGITISIGGEIGEVGKHNSTETELHTYMEGFNVELEKRVQGSAGLSKISIQTGTSHGGVVLPDGSIAEVKVDFNTLRDLSRVARSDFGLGGTVQHGASTLPEDAFGKFVESEACEVHLATNFMNMFFDRAPVGLRQEMYSWLDVNQGTERKADMTDEQFYYKTRKNALGPYKSKINALPASFKHELGLAWEAQFDKLFRLLGLADTRQYVEKYIKTVAVQPNLNTYLGKGNSGEEVGDLAD
ncbi:MAG: class II fructose-bisphosphate aldolase, partial [Anaerolineales bacterium]|nr:class II fructose-bisphosphate aldolase [Anaerolineales bacterium]